MKPQMLVPEFWKGTTDQIKDISLQWLQKLPKKTYCALWLRWPKEQNFTLPTGFDFYVISFHLEVIDIEWIYAQCEKIDSPIILLSDNNYYNWPCPSNLFPYTYYYWHQQLDKMQNWFPGPYDKNIKHKVSALTNRISQSKLIIFTKLIETFRREDLLLTLSTWLDDKNVHGKIPTGNKIIDDLSDIFFKKYCGTEIKLDDFNNITDNYQKYTANPNSPAYQNCALNFTNESFHYSLYQDNAVSYIYPGPFLTEKTFKCLLGGTAFISVGQFDTYDTLSNLGFQFDYKFSTQWDQEPRNINRLLAIIKLIDQISFFSAVEIFEMTKDSSQHNQDHILSGQLGRVCQEYNDRQIHAILEKFSH